MAETVNIGEISTKLSNDIFRYFLWKKHPKHDDNFQCCNNKHLGEGRKPKTTHPGDVVFFYEDPYLGKTIYLHTDLKSYAASSITSEALRKALRSLCMTVECANESSSWREKYSVDEADLHEVRGLLFVHNHDNSFQKSFHDEIEKVNVQTLPVAAGSILHYLGPEDILRLFSIANDIIRLRGEYELPRDYTFYYPDLVMFHRQGDVWNQPATIEVLTGPYIIIKHGVADNTEPGYVIYYNRNNSKPEEFQYFLYCLSRYQMLDSGQRIRIRITSRDEGDDLKSIFNQAKKRYVKAWGFDPARAALLDKIEIERMPSFVTSYNAGDMGWRE